MDRRAEPNDKHLWLPVASLRRIVVGASLIAMSLLALAAPLTTGTWSLQFLSLFPLAVGLSDFHSTVTNPHLRTHPTAYAASMLALAAALLLFISPSLAVSGVVVLLIAFLAMDGALKVGQAVLGIGSNIRLVTLVNGASSVLLALLSWILWRRLGVETAIGVAVAGYTAAAGWRTIASPARHPEDVDTAKAANIHPDLKLGLPEHELLGTVGKLRSASVAVVATVEAHWLLVLGVVLFAIHLGRMQSTDTWLGLVSPFVATAGDALMAIALGAFLVLPLRLCWRRVTRPVERKAWWLRLSGQDANMDALPRRLIQTWTDARFSFSASLRDARGSLPSAGALAIRLGLPLTVLFVAINPIWGFSWYFNTESWASAFYQKMAELRVDTWRASMVDAVKTTYGGSGDELFRVNSFGHRG